MIRINLIPALDVPYRVSGLEYFLAIVAFVAIIGLAVYYIAVN